jgi:hypothetical protein
MIFKIFTVVRIKIVVFWVMTPSNFVGGYVAGHVLESYPVLLPEDKKEYGFTYFCFFVFYV